MLCFGGHELHLNERNFLQSTTARNAASKNITNFEHFRQSQASSEHLPNIVQSLGQVRPESLSSVFELPK